jgi:penicillin amidase/acyl-homoserine-lactone acylase
MSEHDSKPKPRARVWPIAIGAAILLAVGAAYAVGVRLAPLMHTKPSLAAAQEAAKAYDGVIARDQWGIAHVSGSRDADAAFALAYAQCEDDFKDVQAALKQLMGPRGIAENTNTAATAYVVQSFRVEETVAKIYETDLAPQTRALLDGFAAGLNLCAAERPHEATPGLFPIEGRDLAEASYFISTLFYGMSGVLAKLMDAEREAASGQALKLSLLEGADQPNLGSNGFAIGPRKSADGATRLIVNSHQPLDGPLAWYEAHMQSAEGLNFAGGTLPGGAVMYVGANPDLAYTATTNRPDLIDVFKLEVDDAKHPRRYKLDGQWKDLEIGEAVMHVRLWGPLVFRATRKTYYSAHGPVLKTPNGFMAVRYATIGNVKSIESFYRMMKAASVAEVETILAENDQPNQNRIVADKTGAVARYYVARMPVRIAGVDYRGILPGDRSDLIWTQFEPFARLPHSVNPNAGYVFEANSSPFRLLGEEDPKAEAFPQEFGIETEVTNRARRAFDLMKAKPTLTRDDLLAVKFDQRFHEQSFAAKLRSDILAKTWSPELSRAVEIIRAWDLGVDRDNRSAALAMHTMQPIGAALHVGQKPPPLEETFPKAAAFLQQHYGRLDPPWGGVQRLVRGQSSVGLAGGPDILRASSSRPNPETGVMEAINGDGFMMLITWDKDGAQSVEAVQPYGASNREGDEHYTDQMGLFAEQRFRRVAMDTIAVEAATMRRYRPGEENHAR